MKNDLGFSRDTLERMCQPEKAQPINWTTEIYSAGREIRKFGFYPSGLKIDMVVQHGIYPTDKYLDKYDVLDDAEYYYAFSRRIKDFHDASSKKKSFVAPPPFLLFRKRKQISLNRNAKGTIFFPSHSSLTADSIYDITVLINWIKCIDERFRPIAVCLHWVDINKYKRHLEFLAEGIPVYSCGYAYNDDFADKFYEISSNFCFAGSNEVTSALFYCYDLGLKPFLDGPRATHNEFDTEHIFEEQLNQREQLILNKAEHLFKINGFNDLNKDRIELSKFIEEELGLGEGISRLQFIYVLYKSLLKRLLNKES